MNSVGTYIQYGNVRLYRVVTREIHQEPVFDESRTDLLYQKTTIRVSGFLHGHQDWSYFVQIPYVTNDSGVTMAHKLVRYQLPPRLPFVMAIGAVASGPNMVPNTTAAGQPIVILEAYPAPLNMTPPGGRIAGNINLQNLDVTNGPRCLDFVVTAVTGNELFAVEATFEICKLECNPDGTCPYNTFGVLSNRWSTQDTLDANMRTTRTYTGVTVVASANINLQMLRWIIAPPLQPLFRRDRMDFQVTADGLKLRWSVTDVEIAVSAPFPARRWQVTHSEGSNGAQMGKSSVNVYLEGDSNVNKSDLVEIALYVITMKMFNRTPPNLNRADANYIVESIEFTDHIGDVNAISASAVVRKVTDALSGLRDAMRTFGRPIAAADLPPPLDGTQGGVGANAPYNAPTNPASQYDRSLSWGGYVGQVPNVQGPAQVVGIMACYLQNPCDNVHGAFVGTGSSGAGGATVSSGSGNSLGTGGASGEIPYTATTVTALPTTTDPIYSTSQLTSAYKFWQIDNVYKRRSMNVPMPIASSPSTPYANTTAMVTLAGAQALRIIRVHGERVGDWPEFFDPSNIPAWPTPSSPPSGYAPITQTYVTHKLKPGTPTYTATGQPVYRATMEIIIALSRPPTPTEQLALGNDKWTNLGGLTTTPTLTNSSW